jgi:hypothetical protein
MRQLSVRIGMAGIKVSTFETRMTGMSIYV